MKTAATRDAIVATVILIAAIWAGSGGGRHLDPALFGYLGATIVATGAVVWRVSAFWRRRPSAFYARALANALREPRRLRTALGSGARDVAGQRFIAARGRLRWLAHMALSLGTVASFAITVPLVCGWLRFAAEGQGVYRPIAFGVPLAPFALDGVLAWLMFHGLAMAGAAVALGATYFLVVRLRARTVPGVVNGAHVMPLVLLLIVALTGLALPTTRMHPRLFDIAAWAHEVAVIVLLVALPFSKLGHVLIRPLQIGARVVRGADAEWIACEGCGVRLAPHAQIAAVTALLAERGARGDEHFHRCPACRRRSTAAAQARLVGAGFHPDLVDAQPRPTVAPARRPIGRAA